MDFFAIFEKIFQKKGAPLLEKKWKIGFNKRNENFSPLQPRKEFFMKKFAHYGAVLAEKKEGMMYLDSIKCWATDPTQDPNMIEYLYFEPDSPMADLPVAKGGHIAYLVDDIDAKCANKVCFWPPMDVLPGVRIAFFTDENGVVTEYCQMS